ncbi:MAG: UDP-N-acetylglucosamine 1-carboxyvinyltransferase [Actinomycetota bacterium]
MTSIVVRGGRHLEGELPIVGAKNSALKLLAATLLAPGRHVLHSVPAITDVGIMCRLLEAMGASTTVDGSTVTVDVPEEVNPEAPYELVEQMRASIVVLGPLLARFGRARVALPGGDDFGHRPIDLHLAGLQALGVEFEQTHGYIDARADLLLGARVVLEYPSVGATENLLMASVLAKGTTTIENAAREPEIADLSTFLKRMGARIAGVGSSTLTVEGVEELSPTEHTVVPDRIQAATYLSALAVAGGELTLVGARHDHMDMVIAKLTAMGMRVSNDSAGLWAAVPRRLRAVDVATLPYPGVATDYKPFLVTALSFADGVSIVTENVFQSGRWRYVGELARMGADIRVEGHHAVVRGVERLSGAPVRAHDIRAGAALVCGALGAEGETEVAEAHHVDRGYEDLVAALTAVGADLERR